MRAEDLFHTGIVVDDLEAALAALTEAAGHRWGPVVGGDTPIVTADGERTVPMRIAFSASEPRLELLAAIPDTIWQPTDAGVHHLGYWSDDVEADVRTLLRGGYALEARAPAPGGSSLWAYCRSRTGPRIELVTRALEPTLRSLFAPAG